MAHIRRFDTFRLPFQLKTNIPGEQFEQGERQVADIYIIHPGVDEDIHHHHLDKGTQRTFANDERLYTLAEALDSVTDGDHVLRTVPGNHSFDDTGTFTQEKLCKEIYGSVPPMESHGLSTIRAATEYDSISLDIEFDDGTVVVTSDGSTVTEAGSGAQEPVNLEEETIEITTFSGPKEKEIQREGVVIKWQQSMSDECWKPFDQMTS